MKIGVVTYTHCYNQGADLQAYAMTHILNGLGHESEVIWFDRDPLTKSQRRMVLLRALLGRLRQNLMTGCIDVVLTAINILKRRLIGSKEASQEVCAGVRSYDLFWLDYIPHSEKKRKTELPYLKYDCYITGSDQVWNWRLTGDISPYFLMFAPKDSRKMSYAASVGVEEIDQAFVEVYKKGLSNLDAISVRETQGTALMQKFTDKSVTNVLDPTLLLDMEQWGRIESSAVQFDFPYILSYSLNLSERYRKLIVEYAKKHNVKVVNVTSRPTNESSSWVIDVCNAGPREFLYLIHHATAVFTNSFHGTAFAINFHKQFMSVLNPYSSGNSRIQSITTLLGLQEHVVFDNGIQSLEWPEEVDYRSVDVRLASLKRKSMQFLKEALDG